MLHWEIGLDGTRERAVARGRTRRRLWIAVVLLVGGLSGIGVGLLLVHFLM